MFDMKEFENDLVDLENMQEELDDEQDWQLRFDWKAQELFKKYGVGRSCVHCGKELLPSIIGDYDYQCVYCDEDFYEFESNEVE